LALRLVECMKFAEFGGERPDDRAAPVLRIRLALDVPGLLQAVQGHRDSARGKKSPAGEFSRRRDASQKSVNEMVDQLGLSWLSTIFTKVTFRLMLLRRAYTRSEFERFVSQTGFQHADIKENPIGFEIRLQK